MSLKIVFSKQAHNQQFATNLKKVTGFDVISIEQDLIIDLSTWPKEFSLHKEHLTIKGKLKNKAERDLIFKQIQNLDDVRMYENHLEKPIPYTVYQRYEFLSELYHKQFNIFSSRSSHLAIRLEEMYQLLNKEFELNSLYCFFIDSEKIQAISSVLKISYMYNEFGIEKTIQFIENGVMEGLIPSGTHFKSFVESFLMLNPTIHAFPLSRFETHIFMIPKRRVIIPNVASMGVPENFSTMLFPFSGKNEHNPIFKFDLSSLRIIELCEVANIAINNLFKYVFNLKNYASSDDVVDGFKFLEAFTAVWLIFSDFTSASTSFNDYSKNVFSFSCLDKIANFLFKKCNKKETEIWNSFFTKEMHLKIDLILKNKLKNNFPELYNKLSKYFNQNFERLTQEDSLKHMRVFRNLQHGPYLKFNQFTSLFEGQSQGKFTIGSVYFHTYIIVLAFSLAPQDFIDINSN